MRVLKGRVMVYICVSVLLSCISNVDFNNCCVFSDTAICVEMRVALCLVKECCYWDNWMVKAVIGILTAELDDDTRGSGYSGTMFGGSERMDG